MRPSYSFLWKNPSVQAGSVLDFDLGITTANVSIISTLQSLFSILDAPNLANSNFAIMASPNSTMPTPSKARAGIAPTGVNSNIISSNLEMYTNLTFILGMTLASLSFLLRICTKLFVLKTLEKEDCKCIHFLNLAMKFLIFNCQTSYGSDG